MQIRTGINLTTAKGDSASKFPPALLVRAPRDVINSLAWRSVPSRCVIPSWPPAHPPPAVLPLGGLARRGGSGRRLLAVEKQLEQPGVRRLIATEWTCSIGRSLSGLLREFLTAFGYECPALRAVAIYVHFRIEPTRLIERASLDQCEPRHDGDIREDWRPAFRTKVPVNRLTTVASVVKCLNSSLN